MARQLLTAIDQIETRQTTQQTVIEQTQIAIQEANLTAQFIATIERAKGFQQHYKETLRKVQFTTVFIKNIMPTLPLQERQERLHTALLLTPEERKAEQKNILSHKEQELQELNKRSLTRLERWLQEQQEHLTPLIGLNLIDHTALCMTDKLLWESNPEIISVIMRQLVTMCESKSKGVPTLIDHVALQKQLLELYVSMYSMFPFGLNMLAMRISALSRQALLNKSMTLYAMGATQAQTMKPKYQLAMCENRRLETKQVSSGKSVTEAVPEKFSVGVTEHLTEEEKIGLFKNMKGKELPFIALRYAYSMPYWLRRFLAIHMGYPENAKYALYFGIGGLPTRRSMWKRKFMQYPEARYLQYSADEHVRNLISKVQSKRGHFIKRYGKYYRRRRV